MRLQVRQVVIALVVLMIIIPVTVHFGCQKKSDIDFAEINQDNHGGGSAGGGDVPDDDDSADDDDDDDDADDDDDDDDSPSRPIIAVIYGQSIQNSQYESFLAAYGIDYSLIAEADVPEYDFSPFDAILATETAEFYSSSAVQTVATSGLGVVGVFTGGALLFGYLGGYADLGGGNGYTMNKIKSINRTHQIWSFPYEVTIYDDNSVVIAQSTINGWAHSTVAMPSDMQVFGEVWATSQRGILTYQAEKYFFWGLEFETSFYTVDALKLLANTIYLVSGFKP